MRTQLSYFIQAAAHVAAVGSLDAKRKFRLNAIRSLSSALCNPQVRRTHFRDIKAEAAAAGALYLASVALTPTIVAEAIQAAKDGIDPSFQPELDAAMQTLVGGLVPLAHETLREAEAIAVATRAVLPEQRRGRAYSTIDEKSACAARHRVLRHLATLGTWPELNPAGHERLLGEDSGRPLDDATVNVLSAAPATSISDDEIMRCFTMARRAAARMIPSSDVDDVVSMTVIKLMNGSARQVSSNYVAKVVSCVWADLCREESAEVAMAPIGDGEFEGGGLTLESIAPAAPDQLAIAEWRAALAAMGACAIAHVCDEPKACDDRAASKVASTALTLLIEDRVAIRSTLGHRNRILARAAHDLPPDRRASVVEGATAKLAELATSWVRTA